MAPSSSLVGKIKMQLKLAISRLRMVQQKEAAIAKQQRRAMAGLLEAQKTESALIRVENIIRTDIQTELHEILELYCELLLARAQLLEAPQCDPGLEEATKSIVYAAPRTEIKELHQVRQLLVEKFGKEFALQAMENSDEKVSERVLTRLRVEPPKKELVVEYLEAIAEAYGVDWPKREGKKGGSAEDRDDDDNDDDDEPGDGHKVRAVEPPLPADTEALSRATPPRDLGPKSPVSIAPPSPSTDNVSPRVKLPGPPELKPGPKMSGLKRATPGTQAKTDTDGGGDVGKKKGVPAVGGKIPDVDELAKRFAALKK
ncbi:MAG: hypothetical protein M1817_001988 [Caeruleum heppii]|nr:MAG: hypothetical protein M1817_001988 [Caeruleum heppii]